MGKLILEDRRLGGLRLDIDPEIGAGITFLGWQDEPGRFLPLLRPAHQDAAHFNDLSSYSLAPWSNRIAGAMLAWCGKTQALQADWPDGTAIHGLVKDMPWHVRQRSPVSAVLALSSGDNPGLPYPWAFETEVVYRIDGGVLSAELSVKHIAGGSSPDPMPAGLGFHPYWLRNLGEEPEDVTVRLNGLRRYPCKGMIPVGPPVEDEVTRYLAEGRPLSALTLDDVFLGSCDGAEIVWPRSRIRARYTCSEELGHAVIYTGPPEPKSDRDRIFCLEPVTMVNNGFNLESRGERATGVRALRVGESMRVSWSVKVVRIQGA